MLRHDRPAVFLLIGLVVLLVATGPPGELVFDSTFTGHMGQHLVLVVVVGSLLAAGLPFVLHGAPKVNRRRRLPALARREGASPVTALLLAAVLTLWHVPWAYDATTESSPAHVAEHLTMIVAATVFWYVTMVVPRPVRAPVGPLLGVAIVAVQGAVLGILLMFSDHVWYASYAEGRGPEAVLSDQQSSGALMWSAGGIAPVVAALWLVARWLSRLERRSPANGSPAHPSSARSGASQEVPSDASRDQGTGYRRGQAVGP